MVEKGEDEGGLTLLDELVKMVLFIYFASFFYPRRLSYLSQGVDLIKDETLNIFVAAKDTTSATLTCVINMLAEYPYIPEINQPTYDIKESKYLRAVIKGTCLVHFLMVFHL